MALFDQYTEPGVYTDVELANPGVNLFGNTRIPVLIGEGQETKSYPNVEMHRGSSAFADEKIVNENLSDQVDGITRQFSLGYFPVVKGTGKGVLASVPTDISVYVDGNPVVVSQLDSSTGNFYLQQVVPEGSNLTATYYFKRKDTAITDEDMSLQIPTAASFTAQTGLTISLTIPGSIGNVVGLEFTTGVEVSDALAVSGVGTDTISIGLTKVGGGTRTLANIKTLIDSGIPTLSAGYLTATLRGSGTTSGITVTHTHFSGGLGQNTSKIYKVMYTPIVDGSNGGVVTTNPKDVTVKVNNVPVSVIAVDGANGLITLASAVSTDATLSATYYTNTYQDTYDILPQNNIAVVNKIGLGPDRDDYINGVDFVLDGNKIQWGASASVAAAFTTSGYESFNGQQITPTLIDEKVYLRPVTGVTDGRNTLFTLEDSPVDGSGLSRATDNPALISVFVGANPVAAYLAGAVRVTRLVGSSASITLFNPPTAGAKVYATYYRNTLNDHTYTAKVVLPGITGQGTYKLFSEEGDALPVVSLSGHTVTSANFSTTGIVWPTSFSDLKTVAGAPDELITLTFQDDTLSTVLSPATQATNTVVQTGLRFRATNTGTGPNGVTSIQMQGSTEKSDGEAVAVTTEHVDIYITKVGGAVRTLAEILSLFANGSVSTPIAGVIIAESATAGQDLGVQAAQHASSNFSGGTAAVTDTYSVRYVVTSNRTSGNSLADGKGISAGTGYLGQTYIDAHTGIQFTIVDPAKALGYGYTTLPSPSYVFKPNDVLLFAVTNGVARYASAIPTIAVPGLRTKVVTTYGTNSDDYATISTYNKAGSEPHVGDYYFVSFATAKAAADYALHIFSDTASAYALYGSPIPQNRLSLGVRLHVQNGAQVFGCIQVPKQVGMDISSDQDFIAAIQSLAMPLPGSERKCDAIIPLSTSTTVLNYLGRHLITQASARQKGEAMGFVGLNNYVKSSEARQIARGLRNSRVVAIGNPSVAVEVEVADKVIEYAVDGSFLAAALAGVFMSPANDVATTLTRQRVAGFSRMLVRYDNPTMDMMASDGLTMLVERGGAFIVRHYISTDPSSPLTREPTCTTAVDHVRQGIRGAFDPFIGKKYANGSLLSNMKIVGDSYLKAKVGDGILEAYANLQIVRDSGDPTVCHVSVAVKPEFSLLWVDVKFTVTIAL